MFSWYSSVLIFLFVAIFSPGPNNIIAMNIGYNNDLKKILPHLFAVMIGFTILTIIVSIGIKDYLIKYYSFFIYFKYICSIYLLYLAYKIANSSQFESISKDQNVLTFKESFILQIINPKSWIVIIALITLYIPINMFFEALLIIILNSIILIVLSITFWAYSGKGISKILKNSKYIKIFNYFTATLLVYSVYTILQFNEHFK